MLSMMAIFRHLDKLLMLLHPITQGLTMLERVDSRNSSQVTPGFRARVPRIDQALNLGTVVPALICDVEELNCYPSC